jgi:hypothetical protein
LNNQRKDEILTLEEVINIFASFDLAGGMHKHEEQILKLELFLKNPSHSGNRLM